jgi:hypothetical protein
MPETVVVNGKAYDFAIEGTDAVITLDTDKDGEPSVKIIVSMAETLQEALEAVKKVL